MFRPWGFEEESRSLGSGGALFPSHRCPTWADPVPVLTLAGADRGHLQSAPCPALRALPACGLSRQPAWLAYHCGPWASTEEVQPGGKGGGKTLVVMVTTHGHRMPFRKVWVGVHSSPCGGKGYSSGEKNCCSLGTDASRGGEEQAQHRARRLGLSEDTKWL